MGARRRRRCGPRTSFDAAIARARVEAGPWVIVAKVAESAPTVKPPLDCVFIKQRFMAAIGSRRRRRGRRTHDSRYAAATAADSGDFVVDRRAAGRGARRARRPRCSTRSASRSPARRSRRAASCSSVVASEGGDACSVFGTAWPRQRQRRRARQRHRRARARLRRHVLRLARAPERAAGAGGARGRRAGRRLRPRRCSTPTSSDSRSKARLGRLMNPRHYQRGWHCTSTLGTIGAAAAVSRLLGLDAAATGHALAIAASAASGLKENFGTMVKPLHAGLAARNGVHRGAAGARAA